jgi:hypothetical protein
VPKRLADSQIESASAIVSKNDDAFGKRKRDDVIINK